MRWLVEVSSLGKTDIQKIVVDAESWQRALQAARAQRGEEGPMSGFSIELLEEGYRAVDPVARVRFVVKRAPDDMPVTTDLKAGGGASGPTSANRPAAPAAPKADEKESKKSSIPPPPVGSAVLGLPPIKLIASREQEPTEAQPLIYREYAFAVAEGTSDEVAEKVLRKQLEIVQGHIAGGKMGKLVNLAVFDVEFQGKPPRPPIATLAWKDWKGDAVVSFPKKTGAGATSKPPPSVSGPASVPQPPPASAKPASVPPPAPPVAKPVSVPPPAPPVVQVQPAFPPPAPAQAPAQAATPAPPVVQAQPKPASVPPPAPPVVHHAPAQVVPPPPPAPVIAEAHDKHAPAPGMVKTPSGRFVRGRVSGDELITSLFEAMHDLHFLRDALDGGQFCLALATEVLPSRAAMIHFFDIEKRDWITACVRGKDTHKLLTARTPENDEMLIQAARKRRAVVTPNAEGKAADRYQKLGGARSVIVAPVMQAGRALGALEILNPLDGMPFTEDEGNAMTYIAEQYAEYLGSRGIVTDGNRIHSAASAH